MTEPEQSTPLVALFGNSVFFPESWFEEYPRIFQALLFYPDYYFMAWPFQLIGAFLTPGHPYFNTTVGEIDGGGSYVLAMSMLHIIFAFMFIVLGVSKTFKQLSTPKPLEGEGAIAFLFNILYFLIWKIGTGLLFWHIIFARIVAAPFIALSSNYNTQLKIFTVILCVFCGPAVINMFISTMMILFMVVS